MIYCVWVLLLTLVGRAASATVGYGPAVFPTTSGNPWITSLQLVIDDDFDKVYLTITGPAARWYGIGFGTTMLNTYAIAFDAQGFGFSEWKLGLRASGTPLQKTWNIEYQNKTTNLQTMQLSRSLTGLTADHFTFDTSVQQLPVISCLGNVNDLSMLATTGHSDRTTTPEMLTFTNTSSAPQDEYDLLNPPISNPDTPDPNNPNPNPNVPNPNTPDPNTTATPDPVPDRRYPDLAPLYLDQPVNHHLTKAAASSPINEEDDGLGAGAIAGIILGCLCCCLLLVAVIVLATRKKKPSSHPDGLGSISLSDRDSREIPLLNPENENIFGDTKPEPDTAKDVTLINSQQQQVEPQIQTHVQPQAQPQIQTQVHNFANHDPPQFGSNNIDVEDIQVVEVANPTFSGAGGPPPATHFNYHVPPAYRNLSNNLGQPVTLRFDLPGPQQFDQPTFKNNIASSMGVRPDQISIMSVRQGSVIVDMQFKDVNNAQELNQILLTAALNGDQNTELGNLLTTKYPCIEANVEGLVPQSSNNVKNPKYSHVRNNNSRSSAFGAVEVVPQTHITVRELSSFESAKKSVAMPLQNIQEITTKDIISSTSTPSAQEGENKVTITPVPSTKKPLSMPRGVPRVVTSLSNYFLPDQRKKSVTVSSLGDVDADGQLYPHPARMPIPIEPFPSIFRSEQFQPLKTPKKPSVAVRSPKSPTRYTFEEAYPQSPCASRFSRGCNSDISDLRFLFQKVLTTECQLQDSCYL